ncbi:hypothetical protein RMATCC62417_18801 [Rhizopus microsporus]|nr:hypothetical protein RMATCC62417_18801 [Rhizopus microsporus]
MSIFNYVNNNGGNNRNNSNNDSPMLSRYGSFSGSYSDTATNEALAAELQNTVAQLSATQHRVEQLEARVNVMTAQQQGTSRIGRDSAMSVSLCPTGNTHSR